MLAVLSVGAACGGSAGQTAPGQHPPSSDPVAVVVTPAASNAEPGAASAAPSPTAPDPSLTVDGATGFTPPDPVCPAPAQAVRTPIVTVSVEGGATIAATGAGSGFLTCSTAGADEGIPVDPAEALTVRSDDILRLSLPDPWRFLRWSGSISDPGDAEGEVIWTPVETPHRPASVAVVAVGPPGESVASFHLNVITIDGRAVGYVDVRVRVDVR